MMLARLTVSLALAAAALSQTVPTGYYPATIATAWNAKNVLQPATPVKSGSALVIYSLAATVPEQKWLLKDGATKIILNGTNYCIDAGTGRNNGSPITVNTCSDTAASQNWTYNTNGQIVLANTNLCADLYAGGLNNGNKIVVWGCISGDKNHIWQAQNLTAKPT